MVNSVKNSACNIGKIRSLTWWIATLFMIGASLFVAGSILFLWWKVDVTLNGMIFFIGSLFFTSAAYCQYYQSINKNEFHQYWYRWQAKDLTVYVALYQFIGTILFNFNTFDTMFSLGWFGQDLLVWGPDILGSILFQISGCLGLIEMNKRGVNSSKRGINWYIGITNFSGCIAFLISACLAFVLPHPIEVLSIYSTMFTLVGALCFFTSAYLMWLNLSFSSKP